MSPSDAPEQRPQPGPSWQAQPYGRLNALNSSRLVLDAVGEDLLTDIVAEYLALLETSAAVYERTGDYALGLFSSGWCRLLDAKSREGCGTTDNREALACGKWHCHESCWAISKESIDKDEPVDLPCLGGIRIYAVPIHAGGEVVGSINFGYGTPPDAPERLREVAERYGLPVETLRREAAAYAPRPESLIALAKHRVATAAKLIGALVERRRAEAEIRRLNAELEQRVSERTAQLRATNQALAAEVAQRERAEEALARSRAMLRQALDAIPQYVFWKDRESRYLGCNSLFAEAAGVEEPDAIVGKTDFDLPWKETAEVYRADDRAVMDSGRAKLNYEEPQHRPDGSVLWLRTSKVPLTDREGRVFGVLGIYEDITERKALEARNQRLERLAMLGQLVGGIAHELRNPLFILTGELQLCEEKLQRREYADLPEDLKKVRAAADRIIRITDRFLALARPAVGRPERCLVQMVLRRTLELLANELMRNQITVLTDIAPHLPPVWADPHQLQAVFLNLILNAIQTMSTAHGKGTLAVSATLSADLAMLPPSPPPAAGEGTGGGASWIEVRIQDDGPGIAPEHRGRLFEPFFSTKPPEEGMGLGLWTVRMLLIQFGGTVTFETEVGRGTTFIVRLPATAEDRAASGP
jgi:PAS domain S-box-containing protein